MMCPKCLKDTLDPFGMIEGVHVDFCSGCKGIWFDEGELAFYTEMPVDVPGFEKAMSAAKLTDWPCPHCTSQRLVEVDYLPGQGLHLDVCKECKGVFVDKGELPRIETLSVSCRGTESIVHVARKLEERGYQILGASKK